MHILVIGCGRMGSGVAQALSQRGRQVTAVDKDPSAATRLGPAFQGRLLIGDGLDRSCLIQAGIDQADGLAALTADDETNAVLARLAGQVFHVPTVVARLDDPRKAEIYHRLGVQTIAPVTWGVARIADLLGYAALDVTVSLGHGEVDLREVPVPPLLVGRTVLELSVPGEVQVVAISRGGHTFLPSRGTVFQAGDVLHLAVLVTAAERLPQLLGLP